MLLTSPQIEHRLRFLSQHVWPPKVAVIGGYHCGNLGDIALGASVCDYLNISRRAMQTIYNLKRWPIANGAILGGGSILHNSTLDAVRASYPDPNQVYIIGVDIGSKLSEENLAYLSSVSFLSVRNSHNFRYFQNLGILTHLHPDLAFTLRFETSERKKIALINAVPGFENYDKIFSYQYYSDLLRSMAHLLLIQGHDVRHLPFTQADAEAAEKIFHGLPVKHYSYSTNLYRIFKLISSSSAFVTSRYHALIFALASNTKTFPFLYASKNYFLVEDFFATYAPDLLLGFKETDVASSDVPAGKVARRWIEQPFIAPIASVERMRNEILSYFDPILKLL